MSAHLEALDALIERLAKGWTLKRMPIMDVVILRVAVFELAHRSDVPRGVVLSEAVELASQYGTDDSSRCFVVWTARNRSRRTALRYLR